MKFSILQQDLLPVIQTVSRSVGVRSTLPVLDNILLSTEGKLLKVAATNLEIGVIKFVTIDKLADGEITVPAKTLLELISGLSQQKLDLEAEGSILSISAGKFKASINGIPASEFPAIPLSEGEGVTFKKEFFTSCSQILYAAAVDEGRPVLTGILTLVSKGQVDFVSTDGFRLAHRQIKLSDSKVEFKSLIPKRTFEEILRIIADTEVEEIKVLTSPSQNQIIFDFAKTIVSSRLIEGQFPVWEKIIPTKAVCRALIDKEDLLKAIKLAAIFAKNEANVITLSVSKDKLSLESSAKQLGSQQNEVEGRIEGEELKIAFNSKFLLDAVSNIPTSQLSIEFSGPLSPSLIKPIGEEGLEYIVMPVRLS